MRGLAAARVMNGLSAHAPREPTLPRGPDPRDLDGCHLASYCGHATTARKRTSLVTQDPRPSWLEDWQRPYFEEPDCLGIFYDSYAPWARHEARPPQPVDPRIPREARAKAAACAIRGAPWGGTEAAIHLLLEASARLERTLTEASESSEDLPESCEEARRVLDDVEDATSFWIADQLRSGLRAARPISEFTGGVRRAWQARYRLRAL
jgi:hypothetical protein